MANPSKFYSAALEAAQKIRQKVGTAQQMKSMLLKEGAKPKELEYIGADALLADPNRRVTQQELVDYLDANQLKPEEVVKRGISSEANDERISEIADALAHGDARRFEDLTDVSYTEQALDETLAHNPETGEPLHSESKQDSIWDAAWAAAQDLVGNLGGGDTRWSQYVTGAPSDQYTEHLVTLDPPSTGTGDYRDDGFESSHWNEPNVWAHMRYDFDPDALRLEEVQSDWLQEARDKGFKDPAYTRGMLAKAYRVLDRDKAAYEAFLRRNRLPLQYGTHAPSERNERAAPGFVEDLEDRFGSEVAQDFWTYWDDYQDALENATKVQQKLDAPPRAPLPNVNDWTTTMLRRAMLEAALQDKPRVRWTSGLAQDRRYSPKPGRAKYYDQIIPNLMKKIIRPYGDPQVMSENWAQGAMGRPAGQAGRWNRETGESIGNDEIDMHYVDLPRELIEALQKKGKVPFFKHGGQV